MLKYVLFPGFIYSKNDGQRHYIGPMTLARLYGVDIRECHIYEPAPWWPAAFYKYEEEKCKNLKHLYPRYDGDYKLNI